MATQKTWTETLREEGETMDVIYILLGFGVGFSVAKHYGILWAILYGLGWPAWVGYHVAEYLLR